MSLKPYKIDIAVLCIFFTRDDKFAKVFEQIRKARPSKLFLYQDGPRKDRPDDMEKIIKCRRLTENLDWECEVYTNFQETNVGCDPSEYNALTWMFSHVDKGIILEDDDVPAQSFFPFCKEMLDRYENDTRIFMIAGTNQLGRYNDEYADYFFAERSGIWGWATWKRCVDMLDTQYTFLENEYTRKQLRQYTEAFNEKVKVCTWHRSTGKEYYESILWNTKHTNHMLDIVPSRNQISNIGIGADGTHGGGGMEVIPNGIKRLFYSKTYELKFPLRHPQHVVADAQYVKKIVRILGEGHPLVLLWRSLEGGMKGFWYADKEERRKKLKRLPNTLKKLCSPVK